MLELRIRKQFFNQVHVQQFSASLRQIQAVLSGLSKVLTFFELEKKSSGKKGRVRRVGVRIPGKYQQMLSAKQIAPPVQPWLGET